MLARTDNGTLTALGVNGFDVRAVQARLDAGAINAADLDAARAAAALDERAKIQAALAQAQADVAAEHKLRMAAQRVKDALEQRIRDLEAELAKGE